MKKHSYFYRNGLSIVFILFFLFTLSAQVLTGWKTYNEERTEEHGTPVSLKAYLSSGHCISATFENFQSEFLQMGLYVLLTVGLRQQGSAESKKLDEPEEVDREPLPRPNAPWPVRKGGWIMELYKHSLSIVFFSLFLSSWLMHFYGSWKDHNAQEMLKGFPPQSKLEYIVQPDFWFETFQNWQSEFLSVASIVLFTIYFRQKGSPESKPVDAPMMETGK